MALYCPIEGDYVVDETEGTREEGLSRRHGAGLCAAISKVGGSFFLLNATFSYFSYFRFLLIPFVFYLSLSVFTYHSRTLLIHFVFYL